MTHRTKVVRAGEKAMTAKVTTELKAIGKAAAEEASKRYAKIAKAQKKDEDTIADAVVAGVDWTPVASAAETQLTTVAQDGAKRALLALRISDQGITDQAFEEAADWASDRAAELVGKSWDEDGDLVDNEDADMAISDSLRSEIREAVADAVANGDSAADLASSIEDLAGFSAERAEMVARTEIIRAHGQGALVAFKASGVVKQKGWSTSTEDSVCDECQDNEDEGDIDLDEDFPSGDDAPPAHPNCMCALTASIEAAEDEEDEASEEDEDESTYEAAE